MPLKQTEHQHHGRTKECPNSNKIGKFAKLKSMSSDTLKIIKGFYDKITDKYNVINN